jgi:hypothetical protein
LKHDNGFSVEVSRHDKSHTYTDEWGEGRFGWCVYVYIGEKHPAHDLIDMTPKVYDGREYTNTSQNILSEMPLHGGCTWLSKECKSIKVGCDYGHLYDDRYAHMETTEDAASIFRDADALFDWAKNFKESIE